LISDLIDLREGHWQAQTGTQLYGFLVCVCLPALSQREPLQQIEFGNNFIVGRNRCRVNRFGRGVVVQEVGRDGTAST
jgi:hypothetical protein